MREFFHRDAARLLEHRATLLDVELLRRFLWVNAVNADQIAATSNRPNHPLEAAILGDFPPGEYTAILIGSGDDPVARSGVGLVQAFDLGPVPGSGEGAISNFSTRMTVGSGEDVLIGGFTIAGGESGRVLVRGLGPTLGAPPFGVPGVLADPSIAIFDTSNPPVRVARNDDWTSPADQADAIRALGLAPPDPREAAILTTLPPGAYTAIASGAGGAEGIALLEIYHLP